MNRLCGDCVYSVCCSAGRQTKHSEDCQFYDKIENLAFYPGGSPPRRFCPICIHKNDRCVSSSDISMFAVNHGMNYLEACDYILNKQGYVLTEYNMLEGQCMIDCDRFEEID